MPVTCGVCEQPCNKDKPFAICSGTCGLTIHHHCASKPEGVKTRSGSKEWKCEDCAQTKDSSVSSKSSSDSTVITKSFLLAVIDNLKKEVFAAIKRNTDQQEEFKTSVDFVSNRLDCVNELMDKNKSEVYEVKRQNEELMKENEQLKGVVADLQSRVRAMEQFSRNTNIEISGIPVSPKEDVLSIVKDIGTAIGQELQHDQVMSAHRVPCYAKGRTPSLVVRFQTQLLRDGWITAYKKKRSLTAKEVNTTFPSSRVYLNEHLAPENKLFLRNLKMKCKELNIKYTWCKEGKFFIRKNDGEKCHKINSIDDLAKIFKQH